MAKQLTFNYDGIDYTLEFTRRTVSEMECNGFRIDTIGAMPMTVLPELFAGAFLAHHRFVKRDVIQTIFDKMPNKETLIGNLAEMYNEPIASLISDPEDSEGNVTWTANW